MYRLAYAGQELRGKDRVASQGIEVIMETHTLDIEHLGPEPCQHLLQRRARGRTCRRYLRGRGQTESLRQAKALQFARRACREVIDNKDTLWDLKRRQARRDKLAQVAVSR